MEATGFCHTLIHLLSFLLLSVMLVPPSRAADTLGKGGNITGNATLVSAGGTFTMGFFSLGPSSSKRYYLGIWFTVSPDAVCWVANRESPLHDNAGVLVVRDTGSLVLVDGSGQIAWSSNTSTTGSGSSTSVVEARLLDSGNLVLRDPAARLGLLWQSFDNPSNTLLSGMKVGKDLWDGREWYLTSWRSADDPVPGIYRRKLDTANDGLLPDFVLYQGDAKKYRAGPWNGRRFGGLPEVSTYSGLVTFRVTASPWEVSYGYTANPGAPCTRVVVNEIGEVRRLIWEAGAWRTVLKGPRDFCDGYGSCGPFGLCDESSPSTSFCTCPKGFSPVVSNSKPAAPGNPRDPSAGCRRKVALQCNSSSSSGLEAATTDGFVVVPGVKLPDTENALVDMSVTVEECGRRCRANCSCVAYAAADVRGGGSGCVMWTRDLVDLRYVDQGQDLYLRLARFELDDKGFPLAAVVAPVASTAVVVAVMFLLFWWRRKLSASDAVPHLDQSIGLLRFDLPAVIEAKRDFSQSDIIGEGGFAIVYKGQLPDGRTVAVKRLKQSALTEKGKSMFEREVPMMANLRHGNVLRLLAYCNEGNERILIYPYMQKRSLDGYIFGKPEDRAKLNWRQRLDIIHGVAQGVAYLHAGSDESVVHRDLKPSNILLDDNWRPKIADFNTAKLFISDQPNQSDLTIVVSAGYAAPEYALQGDMTLKCDVFSFGVIMLEILSGRSNGQSRGLISYAKVLWEQNTPAALLDSVVTTLPLSPPDSGIGFELERCISIGLLCVQEAPDDRPDMTTVVAMLTTRNQNISMPRCAAEQQQNGGGLLCRMRQSLE